jgi:hypothetical protein
MRRDVMSGPADIFSLWRIKQSQWAAGHDEQVSCRLRHRSYAPEPGYRE